MARHKAQTAVYYTQYYDQSAGWKNYNYHGIWLDDAEQELKQLRHFSTSTQWRVFTAYI